MSEPPETPIDAARKYTDGFEQLVEIYKEEGRTLNVLASPVVRDGVNVYLDRMANVIQSATYGPVLEDMAVSVVANQLPHQTKGAAREALRERVPEEYHEPIDD